MKSLYVIAAILASLSLAGLGAVAIRTWGADAAMGHLQQPGLKSAQVLRALRHARRLRPDLSQTWRLEASVLSFDSPHQAERLARQAVRLNSLNWHNWHTLAMIELQLGDSRAARNDLTRAIAYDRGFEAHYQLANLAWLLGDRPMFWRQMQAALAIAPQNDLPPAMRTLFELVGPHPHHLLEILPARRTRPLAEAVHFLIGTHHLCAADRAWRRMPCPSYRRTECQARSLELSQAWLQLAMQPAVNLISGKKLPAASTQAAPARLGAAQKKHKAAPEKFKFMPPAASLRRAMRVWNAAIARHLMRAAPVQYGEVADANFHYPWRGVFAWQPGSEPDNVRVQYAPPANNRVEVRLSGWEPSQLNLLSEWVPLGSGTGRYQIAISSQGSVGGSKHGMQLRILLPGGRTLYMLPLRARSGWRQDSGKFHVPRGTRLIQVALAYQRPYGSALMRGRVRLRQPLLKYVGSARR